MIPQESPGQTSLEYGLSLASQCEWDMSDVWFSHLTCSTISSWERPCPGGLTNSNGHVPTWKISCLKSMYDVLGKEHKQCLSNDLGHLAEFYRCMDLTEDFRASRCNSDLKLPGKDSYLGRYCFAHWAHNRLNQSWLRAMLEIEYWKFSMNSQPCTVADVLILEDVCLFLVRAICVLSPSPHLLK